MNNTTDEARNHLIVMMPVEFREYIKTTLAGDFAFIISNKIYKNEKESRELEQENQRLREALEEIINESENHGCSSDSMGDTLIELKVIAQKAIAQNKE